jgi:hypothetical protein
MTTEPTDQEVRAEAAEESDQQVAHGKSLALIVRERGRNRLIEDPREVAEFAEEDGTARVTFMGFRVSREYLDKPGGRETLQRVFEL